MSVDFQIMQDIPENKRGLDHWANPRWLSITNRQQNFPRDESAYHSIKGAGTRGGRPIRVKHPDRKTYSYESKAAFGRYLGYKGAAGSQVIKAMTVGTKLKSGNVKIRTKKGEFIVIVENEL